MKKIESIPEMMAAAAEWRAAGKKIGLVSTMGALHAGQEALIRAARQKSGVVVVSIFVNPLQFGPSELVAKYPRTLEEDVKLCAAAGADAVFIPAEEQMLPRGFSTAVTEEILSKPLDGQLRPAYFRGVTTISAKLFSIIRPHYAFFGQKTAQRAAVVRKMAEDLSLGVEIVLVPTAREPDGLAAGVRNRDLTASQRQEALAIFRALEKAREMVAAGVRSPDRLIAEATHVLGQHRRVRVIYVSVADVRTMEPVREVVPGQTMLAIAAWVDEVRLIDNTVLV
jgi:pantoate--beta-alanine ligase